MQYAIDPAPAMSRATRRMVGVLGGMGPVASAEFLKTIYEEGMDGPEQTAPAVVVYSDPSFPERTSAFFGGREDSVYERLVDALGRLEAAGASDVILCCFTVHHLVPRLPPPLRARIISLIELAIAQLQTASGQYLLVCSTPSRRLGLFEQHPAWSRVAARVVLPDAADQETIHTDILCAVKRNASLEALAARLDGLLAKYGTGGFIAGCSEMHVLAKYVATRGRTPRVDCIDPLAILAQRIRAGHALRQSESSR